MAFENKRPTFTSLRKMGTVATVALGVSLFSVTGLSAQTVGGDGGKARISLAGKLRTISQQIAADACYLAQGVDVEYMQSALILARDNFNTILSALHDGDVTLGVPSPEYERHVITILDDLDAEMQKIDAAIEALSAGTDIAANAAIILDSDHTLLDLSDFLSSQITGIYSNPHELSQGDAVAINLAGRQRMFSQMLKKLACEIVVEPDNAKFHDELVTSIELFERSLMALRDGLPEVGVRKPPNDGIREELDRAWTRWTEVRPVLVAIGETGAGDLESVEVLTDGLLLNMDNVVTRYLIAVPGSEDIFRVPLRAYAENELMSWFSDPVIIDTIKAQNTQNAAMTQEQIDTIDKTWRAETKLEVRPFIDQVMALPASVYLLDKQNSAAGFVTEVFVMDNKGLNVAQSGVTSDYWQGDEDKWQQTYGRVDGGIHISEAEFDDSTQAYQAQVSFPIIDPATNEKIGAVTLGVNLQFLL